MPTPAYGRTPLPCAELRSVFLEDKRSLKDGSHVEPVFAKSGPAHEVFLRQYVGKSDDELRTYYRTLVFTGTGAMPKFLASDAEIVNYVATTKGAIGYVSSDSSATGVKVLAISQAGATSSDNSLPASNRNTRRLCAAAGLAVWSGCCSPFYRRAPLRASRFLAAIRFWPRLP